MDYDSCSCKHHLSIVTQSDVFSGTVLTFTHYVTAIHIVIRTLVNIVTDCHHLSVHVIVIHSVQCSGLHFRDITRGYTWKTGELYTSWNRLWHLPDTPHWRLPSLPHSLLHPNGNISCTLLSSPHYPRVAKEKQKPSEKHTKAV